MTRDEAFRTFQETLAEVLDRDADSIERTAIFQDDLDVDSLAFAEITIALEEAFSIEIPDPEPEQVQTVGGAFDFVAEVLGV